MKKKSAIKLRCSQPKIKRAFEIPFGKIGIWVVGGSVLLSALSGFFVGFFPPATLSAELILPYETATLAGILIISGLPFVIYAFREKWNDKSDIHEIDWNLRI